jgi:uncharacterized protein YfaS (alpha-2-macroglobulin family)
MRSNNEKLVIPEAEMFEIRLHDPLGKELKRVTQKPNEFGSLFTEFDIPKDAPLGAYSLQIMSADTTEYIENGWTSFQVEVFRNPTFTATVELKSPDIEDDTIRDLRKVPNTDPYTPWYTDAYKGNFTIEGIVKAKYYNGANIRNTPFQYRVYRSPYYGTEYWKDCFWGCYYEPTLEQYTDGSGMIDGDGYGVIRIPVEHISYFDDYTYTVEVTIRDVLTGEEVSTPGSLIVRLPEMYKTFSSMESLIFTPKKKIFAAGEMLSGEINPKYGTWQKYLQGKYGYEIYQRTYNEVFVDDIRMGKTRVTTHTDTLVSSGIIQQQVFSDKLIGAKAGEYHMRITPLGVSQPPEESLSETIFYIAGDYASIRDNTLRVIPEKTVYKPGDTARVLIQVPFTGSTLLITTEK